MSISKSIFGSLDKKGYVELYTIKNSTGAFVQVMTLGAGIHSINVPDKSGRLGDVVLGFDDPNNYTNPDLGFQGLAVARYANRIKGAFFEIDGVCYHVPKNQGENSLHSGGRLSFSLWNVENTTDNSVTFTIDSPDMQDGFPGNLKLSIKYTFTDDNALKIEYNFLSDKKTIVNPTNHSYFNLSADSSKTIEDHLLFVNADKFTETDSEQLPTGVLSDVKGTPMDFTTLHRIGDTINEPFGMLIGDVGYDNNYCLRNTEIGKLEKAAELCDEQSGRKMEVYTDLPGLQVYCGGWLKKSGNPGKGGSLVTYRRGVALETQFYPDAVHHENFPFKYAMPNEPFKTTTEYRFSLMK